jgi:drug/metabolite transporter (DMT)-like permease
MVAFNFLSGSVYSITSSIVFVSTAVFTKLLFRRPFKKTQIVGCIFAMAGVFFTAFAEYS